MNKLDIASAFPRYPSRRASESDTRQRMPRILWQAFAATALLIAISLIRVSGDRTLKTAAAYIDYYLNYSVDLQQTAQTLSQTITEAFNDYAK